MLPRSQRSLWPSPGFNTRRPPEIPQKIGIAKSSFVGAFIGLVIASLAFIGPRIVTDMVIKPVGGVALDTQVGLNCDSVLRNQLVFQRGASTADRMQVVISQIQAQQQECVKDVWKPVAIDMGDVDRGKILNAGTNPADKGQCYLSVGGVAGEDFLEDIKVGDQIFAGGFGEDYARQRAFTSQHVGAGL